MMNLIDKKYDEIDFHNIHDIIPEISEVNSLGKCKPDGIYKTHLLYNNKLDKVVYIIRNPFDAMYSYYHYVNYEKGQPIQLHELIYDKVYGVEALVKHIESYVSGSNDILLIRYEELINGNKKDVYSIAQFMGITINDHIADMSIKLSSFDNMRDIEISKGRKFGSSKFTFTRSGKVGEGLSVIHDNPKLVTYINQEISKSPILAKYYL